MASIGLGEMLVMVFMWIPMLAVPVLALWLLFRGVRALEGIAAALRERNQQR